MKRFAKKHKIKIIALFSVVVTAATVAALWMFYFRKLSRKQIRKRLNFVSSGSPPRELLATSVSDGVDLFVTKIQHFPPVRDQGDCGSCTAFAMAYTLAISFNKQHRIKSPISLSPQLLLSCRTRARVLNGHHEFWKNPCMGFYTHVHAMYLTEGVGYTPAFGANLRPGDKPDAFNAMPLYDDLPYKIGRIDPSNPGCSLVSASSGGMVYTDDEESTRPSGCASTLEQFENACSDLGPLGDRNWTGVRVGRIEKISTTGDASDSSIAVIKNAIMKFGAVACNCTVMDNFGQDTQRSPYEYDPKNGRENDGGHAITCVGWKPGYWLILNSWGREFGCSPSGSYVPLGNGFFYLKFGSMTDKVFAVTAKRVLMPLGTELPPLPEEVDDTLPFVEVSVPAAPLPNPEMRGSRGGFCTIL